MAGSKRLLIVGIDAASPALLRTWAADGTLPNIAQLMATGLVGDTLNNQGYEGATWPSFAASVNPAGHGFYWQEQLTSGTYRMRGVVPSDLCRRDMLWDVLSAEGQRVVVLDVPLARLSPRLNGVQRVEWGGHDLSYGFQTTPRGLGDKILRTVGAYPVAGRCDTERRSLAEYREFADRLKRAASLGARMAHDVMAEEPWDFAIQVFGESHCAGHQLFHLHDVEHPAYDASTTKSVGNLLREVYVALDTAVGEVIANADRNTMVVLLTLHGMTRSYGASVLLPDILTRLGVMHLTSSASGRDLGNGEHAARGLRGAYHRVPEGIRRPLWDLRQHINRRWLRRGSTMNIDPQRTKCFELTLGRSHSGLRLNLRGREPHGTLSAGAEGDQFTEQLTRDLLEITDPDTGLPLVRGVFRTADLFRGTHLDMLPDLVVEWNPELPLGSSVVGNGEGSRVRGVSPRLGSFEAVNTYGRTGDHQLGGMFIARRPGLAPGRLNRVVSNLDLAPTFARYMGCEMREVDGKIIPELLP